MNARVYCICAFSIMMYMDLEFPLCFFRVWTSSYWQLKGLVLPSLRTMSQTNLIRRNLLISGRSKVKM